VWHTYRHKNELFPYYKGAQTDPDFDSSKPTYNYEYPPTPGQVFPFPQMFPPIPGQTGTFNIFNNLDETSEIGLCQMFAHNTTLVAYEAKVNRALFDYANQNQLTKHDANGNYSALSAATEKTKDNLAQYGGICMANPDPSIVSIPCGDNTVAGDGGEGAIEIKAVWRQLTPTEAASGRFLTQTVLF
jgi:hypothetical protein